MQRRAPSADEPTVRERSELLLPPNCRYIDRRSASSSSFHSICRDKRLFNDGQQEDACASLHSRLNEPYCQLADTQSIAINARAAAKAETLTNDKAPSLLVLLHHHDTQLSRLQIVPSRALIKEQLLCLTPGLPKKRSLMLVTLDLDPKYCQSLT